jgi:hypothetical protein
MGCLHLRGAVKKSPSVKVTAPGKAISAQQDSDEARREASKLKADVIIWGWDRKPADKVLVTLNFERLSTDRGW